MTSILTPTPDGSARFDDEPDDTGWHPVGVHGWDIWFDLTPPELISARRLRRLRRWILVGVAAALLVVVGALGLALLRGRQAAADLAGVQSQTAGLTRQQQQYGQAVQIESQTDKFTTQLSGLMAGEVDMDRLLASVQAALPRTMTISELNANVAGSDATAGSTGGSLDTSGGTPIGRLSITGTSQSLADLPDFVTRLDATTGFADVVPTSNSAAQTGTTYTVNLTLTSVLLETTRSATPATTTGASQ